MEHAQAFGSFFCVPQPLCTKHLLIPLQTTGFPQTTTGETVAEFDNQSMNYGFTTGKFLAVSHGVSRLILTSLVIF